MIVSMQDIVRGTREYVGDVALKEARDMWDAFKKRCPHPSPEHYPSAFKPPNEYCPQCKGFNTERIMDKAITRQWTELKCFEGKEVFVFECFSCGIPFSYLKEKSLELSPAR